jgi:hypothetical protein
LFTDIFGHTFFLLLLQQLSAASLARKKLVETSDLAETSQDAFTGQRAGEQSDQTTRPEFEKPPAKAARGHDRFD